MEAWQSWAVFVAAGGAVYYYYTTQSGTASSRPVKGRANSLTSAPAPAQPASSDGGKRKERAKQRKPKKEEAPKPKKEEAPKPKAAAEPAAASKPAVKDEPEATEDTDWVKRLASAQAGVNLSAPTKKDTGSRTVKQKAAGGAPKPSTASKSVDADEEQDASSSFTPSGRDVSDMLEAPAPAPSVLRVTESTKPQAPKKVQQKQAAPAEETKKQRQNRRKVEEKKAQREQEEKERRVLLEQQLRTARQSRGEPAKNGVQPAKAPASSAWSDQSSSKAAGAPAVTNDATQLLDTFDQDAASSASSSNALTNSVASTSNTGASWGNLPPEEEQVRMAMEDSAWNTVTTKKGKKKPSGGDNESTAGDGSDGAVKPVQAPAKAAEPKARESKINLESVRPGPSIDNQLSHPDDSDWAVV